MKIGIIANESERVQKRRKWYEFWKSTTEYEHYTTSDGNVEFVVAYVPEKKSKWHVETANYFQLIGINKIIYSVKQKESKLDFAQFTTYDGSLILYHLSAKIIEDIAKSTGIQMHESTVAYIDKDFAASPDLILNRLCRSCRYLLIVTDQNLYATAKSQELYNEYGLAVEVVPSDMKRIDSDFAIYVNGETPLFSSNTHIIDVHRALKTRSVKDLDLQLPKQFMHNLPFKVNSADLVELLWLNGFISEGNLSDIKIKEIIRG